MSKQNCPTARMLDISSNIRNPSPWTCQNASESRKPPIQANNRKVWTSLSCQSARPLLSMARLSARTGSPPCMPANIPGSQQLLHESASRQLLHRKSAIPFFISALPYPLACSHRRRHPYSRTDLGISPQWQERRPGYAPMLNGYGSSSRDGSEWDVASKNWPATSDPWN